MSHYKGCSTNMCVCQSQSLLKAYRNTLNYTRHTALSYFIFDLKKKMLMSHLRILSLWRSGSLLPDFDNSSEISFLKSANSVQPQENMLCTTDLGSYSSAPNPSFTAERSIIVNMHFWITVNKLNVLIKIHVY